MNRAGAFRFSDSLVAIMDAGDGRLVDVNPAMQRELGRSYDDIVGRRSVDVDFWPNLETRSRVWAHLRSERRFAGDRVVFRGLGGRERSGVLYCEIFEEDGQRHVLAVFQDVRDVGKQDVAKTADPGSYRDLFLAAAEGLYRSLPDGGWIDVNPALARIFGYESPAQMFVETGVGPASALYADQGQARQLRDYLDTHDQLDRKSVV